ncbi:hypothetical protein [Burkholderia diffusa]|uniref:Uncharacterized protein n=1 Tax=Burkholderia diffusa TaxID=488732 RepID=A0A6P2QMX8_9BURK|nr:hypothetical protein [Burkholderia diffusa]KAB0657270.1 hypothetical protein F7R23_11465 [Burkholderia diffusa]MBM2654875.1 hypothetical protein [Burkholderia diffusa]VWC23680.1 hypothetical protein BDI24065_05999 [Burkholderia diffusa]
MVRKWNRYGGIRTDDVDIETHLAAGVMAAHGFWMARYAEREQWLRVQVRHCLTDFLPGDRTRLAAVHSGDFSTD